MAVLVGLVVGVILGLVSIFVNMPMIVLVVVSSIAGAVGVVGGLMLLVGSLNSADFTRGDFTDTVDNGWAWALLLLVLAFVGILSPGPAAGRACAAPSRRPGTPRRPESNVADTGSAGELEAGDFRASSWLLSRRASNVEAWPRRTRP